jgi:hypothetical protein
MLRKCHPRCKKCISKEINSTYMNCIECNNNFYLTEDTKSCFDNVIDNYYIDKNILRRCHSYCKKCISKKINDTYMNCLECNNNFYLTEDTKSCFNNVIDNYYIDNNMLRKCHPRCKKCSSKEINETYMNCLECNNNYYLTEDTKTCYKNVIDNYYLDNNILRRCHPRCKSCYSGSKNNEEMNCIECLNDKKNQYIYQNDSTNCILDSEFTKRENIVLSKLGNDNFYIVIGIFIFSLIVSFCICCCCICIDDDNPVNKNENNKNNNEDDKNNNEDNKYNNEDDNNNNKDDKKNTLLEMPSIN